MLGDMKFLESLKEYDRDNIPTFVMKKIRDNYITNPDFDPAIIRKVSSACEGICSWVRAIEVYDRVAKVIILDNLKHINKKDKKVNNPFKPYDENEPSSSQWQFIMHADPQKCSCLCWARKETEGGANTNKSMITTKSSPEEMNCSLIEFLAFK